MTDVILPDGSVLSSSQFVHAEILKDQQATMVMIGVILDIHPSDHGNNFMASQVDDERGWRHECRVLIVDANNQPNLIFENVVIPPLAPSGIDNFEECLPRGLSKELIDGKKLPEHFKGISFTDLDAEFCIINFIGGSMDRPYIQGWWPHPNNTFDPATSNSTTDGKPTLKQVDLKKNRFRSIRRVNGVVSMVSTKGDVYVDTNEANRHIRVNAKKPTKSWYAQGGSIQVDIKKTQQLEFNFNESVEGLAAGSNSSTQSRDPSKPHLNHTDSTPRARGTSRTFARFKEYEALIKTSGLNLYCKTEGGELGQAVTLADDTVLLMQGEETVASVTLQEGRIQLIAQDGSTISISNDQSIAIVSPNGASISIDSGGNISLQGSSIGISGSTSVGGSLGQPTLLGTNVVGSMTAYSQLIANVYSTWSGIDPPTPVGNAAFLEVIGTATAALAAAMINPLTDWKAKSLTTT